MNRLFSTAFLMLFIMLIITATSCSKTSNHTPVNITLYNKPLNVIQQYITGNWKLIYTDGGYWPIKQYFDSSYWLISATRLKQIYPYRLGGLITDSTIDWVREPINAVDSSYVLYCNDKLGYNYDYVVIEIFYDTLILHENGDDGLRYHFIKQ